MVHKTVRLPSELLQAAKLAASNAGMSLADYIRFALRQAIDRQGGKDRMASVEERMATQMPKLQRRIAQVHRAQQFQFAMLDEYMKVALALEPERLGMNIPAGATWIGRYPSVLQAMGSAAKSFYMVDYVVPEGSAQSRALCARAAKLLSDDDLKRVNRYTPVAYAGTKSLIEAMRRCGKDLTWACTIKQRNATKDMETGVLAPLNFTPTNHFSRQKLSLMKANPKTLEFDPLQGRLADEKTLRPALTPPTAPTCAADPATRPVLPSYAARVARRCRAMTPARRLRNAARRRVPSARSAMRHSGA